MTGFLGLANPIRTHFGALCGCRVPSKSSVFFPIPPDVLMIPMIPRSPQPCMVENRRVALWPSVFLGGKCLGYAIGRLRLKRWTADPSPAVGKGDAMAGNFSDAVLMMFGFWAVLGAGGSPPVQGNHNHVWLGQGCRWRTFIVTLYPRACANAFSFIVAGLLLELAHRSVT